MAKNTKNQSISDTPRAKKSAGKDELTLSKKINQLDAAVDWFYGEDFSLAEAIGRYESAAKLAKEIETDLKTLKNKIEVIEKDFSKE